MMIKKEIVRRLGGVVDLVKEVVAPIKRNWITCFKCGCPAGVKGLPPIVNVGDRRDPVYLHQGIQCPPIEVVKFFREYYGLDETKEE